jgi:hypothetical protein
MRAIRLRLRVGVKTTAALELEHPENSGLATVRFQECGSTAAATFLVAKVTDYDIHCDKQR